MVNGLVWCPLRYIVRCGLIWCSIHYITWSGVVMFWLCPLCIWSGVDWSGRVRYGLWFGTTWSGAKLLWFITVRSAMVKTLFRSLLLSVSDSTKSSDPISFSSFDITNVYFFYICLGFHLIVRPSFIFKL